MRREVLWNWVRVSAAALHRHYVGWCGAATGDASINWDGLRCIAPYVGWCGAATGDASINWDGLRRIAPYTHT